MIGDHRQLRPKLENHALTVTAGDGHDFNVSLFERLVRGGLRHGELAVQHRMRPEISALIRPTYPLLRDGPTTHDRPHIRGLTSDVCFVQHRVPEDAYRGDAYRGDEADADPASKTNRHEVELVLSTVRYLLQQDYKPEQLVVLTPYLSQLHALRNAFRREFFGALLGERDAAALDEALDGDTDEAPSPNNEPSKTGAIRCATIDNFQGEEADIVIAYIYKLCSSSK